MIKHLPNIFSAIRLLLCPVFVYVFFHVKPHAVAFFVFLSASLLDVADGIIARRCNAITDLGKLLDPLADKALQLSAVVSLTVNGDLPVPVLVVLGVKELIMMLGGLLILRKKNTVVHSNKWGKAASFLLSCAICALFFTDSFLQPYTLYVQLFLYLAVAFSVFAMVQYGINWVVRKKPME